MSKMKLICRGWSNWVQYVTKTRQDSDMTDGIGLVYIETDTKLLGPIWPGAIYEENQTWQ